MWRTTGMLWGQNQRLTCLENLHVTPVGEVELAVAVAAEVAEVVEGVAEAVAVVVAEVVVEVVVAVGVAVMESERKEGSTKSMVKAKSRGAWSYISYCSCFSLVCIDAA